MIEVSRLVLRLILFNSFNDHFGIKSGSVVMQFAGGKCKKLLSIYRRIKKDWSNRNRLKISRL